ncbi:MAG: hypothetical protein ACXVJD_16210 [Mucilaginibacter sp.]
MSKDNAWWQSCRFMIVINEAALDYCRADQLYSWIYPYPFFLRAWWAANCGFVLLSGSIRDVFFIVFNLLLSDTKNSWHLKA